MVYRFYLLKLSWVSACINFVDNVWIRQSFSSSVFGFCAYSLSGAAIWIKIIQVKPRWTLKTSHPRVHIRLAPGMAVIWAFQMLQHFIGSPGMLTQRVHACTETPRVPGGLHPNGSSSWRMLTMKMWELALLLICLVLISLPLIKSIPRYMLMFPDRSSIWYSVHLFILLIFVA